MPPLEWLEQWGEGENNLRGRAAVVDHLTDGDFDHITLADRSLE